MWKVARYERGEVVIQKNKLSQNLNRELWAKFNIISKEINYHYYDHSKKAKYFKEIRPIQWTGVQDYSTVCVGVSKKYVELCRSFSKLVILNSWGEQTEG